MSRRNEFLKKISTRYIRHRIYTLVCNHKAIASEFNLYNQTINIDTIEGNKLHAISHNNDRLFLAKEVKNTLIAENTGVTLYKKDDSYKAITTYNGYLSSNYIRGCKTKKILKINTQLINLIGIRKGNKHFFHFFFDYIIPLLFFLKFAYNNQELVVLVRSNYSQFQKDTYDMIEKNFTKVKFLYIEPNYFIKSKNTIFLYHKFYDFYEIEQNPQIKPILEYLRSSLINFYNIKEKNYENKELVYISRSKVRLRRLINEKNIIKDLQKSGFKIINPEKLPFEKQIEIFLNAKLIVGVYGAAFTNIIFGANHLQFLEIFPKKYQGLEFLQIANIFSFTRYEIVSNMEYIWQWFVIDRKKLIKKIDNILNNLHNA